MLFADGTGTGRWLDAPAVLRFVSNVSFGVGSNSCHGLELLCVLIDIEHALFAPVKTKRKHCHWNVDQFSFFSFHLHERHVLYFASAN